MENKCTGECIKCSFQQQIYCSAQYGRAIMTYIPAMMEKITRLESALSSSEIINPLKEDTAQESVGAENRTPEQITQ